MSQLTNQTKHLVIYHDHCNDGFGAAWAAWSALNKAGANIELHAASYGKEPPCEKLDKDTVVHIVDFSYPVDHFERVCELSNYVYLLDHHKTAIEAYTIRGYERMMPNTIVIFDVNKSGAMLAWEYYHPQIAAPRIIKHIEDRDLWQFKLKHTKEVHLNLNTIPKYIETWDELIEMCEDSDYFNTFVAEGAAIDRYYQQLIENILVTNKREVWIDCIKGLSANCPGALASDLGHQLANESGTFGYTWEVLKDGNAKCSLRSNGDFDVAVIAKSFGGGGHKNAAGFILTPELRNSGRILHGN